MKRSLFSRIPTVIFASAAVMAVACSAGNDDNAETNLAENASAVRNFCGNNRCDHGESCSTCSRDCGSCPDAGGSDASTSDSSASDSSSSDGSTSDAGSTNPCGSTAAPPAHYEHVVIFSFENRTWSNVGLGFSASTMPYLHSLASQCSFFGDWTETNTKQSSLTQYIGETSGVDNPNTVNDCSPSTSCRKPPRQDRRTPESPAAAAHHRQPRHITADPRRVRPDRVHHDGATRPARHRSPRRSGRAMVPQLG